MANQERRNPIVQVPHDDLEGFVADVYPNTSIAEVGLLEGGFSHSNYKITFKSGETAVLRVGNASQHLEKEKTIADLIGEKIPTPRFLKLDASQANRQLALLSFEPGVNMRAHFEHLSDEHRKQLVFQAGSILANIHQFDVPSLAVEGSAIEYLLESLSIDKVRQRLVVCSWQELERFFKNNAALLSEPERGSCLVHGDYNRQNILIQKNAKEGWEVTSILDWEFALSGNPLMDVGNFLRPSLFHNYQTQFAEGYTSCGGYLEKDWLKKATLLDFLSMMEFLRLDRDAPELFTRVNEWMRKTMQQW